MFLGYLFGPLLCPAGFNFDGLTALPTDQVMVMAGGASPIKSLAILRLQGVCLARTDQIGEGAIDGCQTNRRAVVSKHLMQLLSANETGGLAQCVPDCVSLPGITPFWLGHNQPLLVVFVGDGVFFVEFLVQFR